MRAAYKLAEGYTWGSEGDTCPEGARNIAETVWSAACEYYKADSDATTRMLADALKELADWADECLSIRETEVLGRSGRGLVREARAVLAALNEPLPHETPEGE